MSDAARKIRDMGLEALRNAAPDIAGRIATGIIESGPFQRWMESVAERRPHGIVALVRRLRGKTKERAALAARDELNRIVEEAIRKYAGERPRPAQD